MRTARYVWTTVEDPSQVAAARREAGDLAAQLGFDASTAGRAALVATELGTNLVKHARGGEIAMRALAESAQLEIIAIDRGPGIRNLSDALRDGYSTAGTPGGGLGAVQRLATDTDVYTGAKGTVIRALVGPSGAVATATAIDVGGISRAKAGETACGDDWGVRHDADGATVLVADGLGHGPLAAVPAASAVEALARDDRDPASLMHVTHGRLRGTRGAAVGILRISAGEATYVGVGNIVCRVMAPGETRQLVSHGGIVGHEARKIQPFSAPIASRGVVVLHSDGIGSQWSLDAYPGLLARHPTLIAAVVHRDFKRGNDDATVVVAKSAMKHGAPERAAASHGRGAAAP